MVAERLRVSVGEEAAVDFNEFLHVATVCSNFVARETCETLDLPFWTIGLHSKVNTLLEHHLKAAAEAKSSLLTGRTVSNEAFVPLFDLLLVEVRV